MSNNKWINAVNAIIRYEKLYKGIELICTGTEDDGEISQDHVTITIDHKFVLPKIVNDQILIPLRNKWEAQRKENNEQIGLFSIELKEYDKSKILGGSHIQISAQRYRYFDAMATNFTFTNRSEGIEFIEKLISDYLLKNGIDKITYDTPLKIFPNPLSVGLTLVCEKGNCLVLTRRSKGTPSGSNLSGGLIFNAVGENTNNHDLFYDNNMQMNIISPWITAQRGLYEEMGLDNISLSGIALHSFVWDKPRLDYKFFGCVVVDLTRDEITNRFQAAPDKNESSDMFFYDIGSRESSLKILYLMRQEIENWSKEAIFCTITSLLSLGKIVPEDLKLFKLLDAKQRGTQVFINRLHRYNRDYLGVQSSKEVLKGFRDKYPQIQNAWRWLELRLSENRSVEAAQLYSQSISDAAPLLNILNHGSEPTKWFKIGLNLAESYDLRTLAMLHLLNIGDANLNIGNYAEAEKLYNRALNLSVDANDNTIKARLLSRVAQSFNYQGQREKAAEFYREAIPLLQKIGDKKEESRCFGGLGWITGDRGDIQGALDNYQKALLLAKETKDEVQEAIHLGAIGTHTWQLGYADKAITYFKEAIILSQSVNDTRREGTRTYNLGTILRHIGEYEESLTILQKAMKIATKNEDSRLVGIIRGVIGECLSDIGDYENALSEQIKGIEMLRSVGYKKYLVFAEVGLGETLLMKGDYNNAIRQLSYGKELAEEANMPAPQLTSNIALARCYLHLGNDLNTALKHIEQACKIMNVPLYDHCAYVLKGVIHTIQGNNIDAGEAFKSAIRKSTHLSNCSPSLYRPLFTVGLAHVGLAINCDNSSRSYEISKSIKAYTDATKICAIRGVIVDAKKLFDELYLNNATLLRPIREIFRVNMT